MIDYPPILISRLTNVLELLSDRDWPHVIDECNKIIEKWPECTVAYESRASANGWLALETQDSVKRAPSSDPVQGQSEKKYREYVEAERRDKEKAKELRRRKK